MHARDGPASAPAARTGHCCQHCCLGCSKTITCINRASGVGRCRPAVTTCSQPPESKAAPVSQVAQHRYVTLQSLPVARQAFPDKLSMTNPDGQGQLSRCNKQQSQPVGPDRPCACPVQPLWQQLCASSPSSSCQVEASSSCSQGLHVSEQLQGS